MSVTAPHRDAFVKSPRSRLLAVLVVAFLTGASYQWNERDIARHAQEMGVQRARLVFNLIQTTRAWIAGHGGAFAPDSPELAELLAREGRLRIRLTSLRPINPANKADPWEHRTLTRFESGTREVMETSAGELRYMAPLVVNATCLQCHASQGYRLGDIRGGISVSQPVALIDDTVAPQRRVNMSLHAVAFAAIAALLWLGLGALRRHVISLEQERDNRRQAADALALKITELEAAQAELVQSEKMASLGRMVAGFAHEVNTPVGIAIGAVSQNLEQIDRAEALLDREEVTEEALRTGFADLRETAALALDNLRRAAGMVTSFKRTSVDQASDENRDFDVAQLIDDVFLGLRNQFKRTAIELVSHCPPGLILHGPAGALVQILNNLFTNSLIHGFDNGSQSGRIEITMAMAEDGHACIVYSDNGAGMDDRVLRHLFEPFFTTRRGQGGSGLGMFIVYDLVTRVLHGDIQCHSQSGAGMRCEIRFPALRPGNPEQHNNTEVTR